MKTSNSEHNDASMVSLTQGGIQGNQHGVALPLGRDLVDARPGVVKPDLTRVERLQLALQLRQLLFVLLLQLSQLLHRQLPRLDFTLVLNARHFEFR